MTTVGIRDKEYGATTAGIATAYTLAIPLFGALEDLKSFNVKFHVTNGLNATLNINGLGAKLLVDENNTALTAALLDTDGIYVFAYNLTNDNFVFMNAMAAGAGYVDPMTTIGDTIYRDAGNITARLPVGADFRKLTSNGGLPMWSTYRLKKTVVTFAMSPYLVSTVEDGEVFILDTSAGQVDIFVNGLSPATGNLGQTICFKRMGPNLATVNTGAAGNTLDALLSGDTQLQTNRTAVTITVGDINANPGVDFFVTSYFGSSFTVVGTTINIA